MLNIDTNISYQLLTTLLLYFSIEFWDIPINAVRPAKYARLSCDPSVGHAPFPSSTARDQRQNA